MMGALVGSSSVKPSGERNIRLGTRDVKVGHEVARNSVDPWPWKKGVEAAASGVASRNLCRVSLEMSCKKRRRACIQPYWGNCEP
jgi:hypothetical protein